MDKNLFLTIANFFQICVAFFIGKYFHGRRIQIIYVVLILNGLLEAFFAIYAFRCNRHIQAIFLVKSTFVFLLYFMICQLGVIDIAKIQALVNNHRLSGSLLCVVIGSQQVMLALVFERYIKYVSAPYFFSFNILSFQIILNFWPWTIIDQITNFACGYFLFDLLKSESTEVRQIKTEAKTKMQQVHL